MQRKESYSQQIKNELIQTENLKDQVAMKLALLTTFFFAGIYTQEGLKYHTSSSAWFDLLQHALKQNYAAKVRLEKRAKSYSMLITEAEVIAKINQDLKQLFTLDQAKDQTLKNENNEELRHILRYTFIAAGYFNNPEKAYHLEISTHYAEAAEWLEKVLKQIDINCGQMKRQDKIVIYLKESQMISDFLLFSGAYQAMLFFESLRVEKEVRNSVNRVVNCDSANTERLANTAVRQLGLIRYIEQEVGLDSLSEDLQVAAQIRLENPECSIRELGEMLEPKLGKSGMNYRLNKIEVLAEKLKAQKQKQTEKGE